MATIKHFLSVLMLLTIVSTSAAKNYRDIIKERHCDATVKVHCANEIILAIFRSGSISDECCKELIKNGIVCHEALLARLLDTTPKYKLNDPIKVLIKSALVWNQCSYVVDKATEN